MDMRWFFQKATDLAMITFEECLTEFNEVARLRLHKFLNLVAFHNDISQVPFPGLHSLARQTWLDIIRRNMHDLNNSKSSGDLYDKLEKLQIPGIGPKTIVLTGDWIIAHNDIDKESNCSCEQFLTSAYGFTNGTKTMGETLDTKSIRAKIGEFNDFSNRELLEFILQYPRAVVNRLQL